MRTIPGPEILCFINNNNLDFIIFNLIVEFGSEFICHNDNLVFGVELFIFILEYLYLIYIIAGKPLEYLISPHILQVFRTDY